MRSTNDARHAGMLVLTLLAAEFLFFLSGCKKDSGPTGPFEPPRLPTVAGHWIGSGSYFDEGLATRLNGSWVADFVQAYVQGWDSKFVGTMSTTWPAISETNIMYCRGIVTPDRKVTLVDTGGVAIFGGKTGPVETGIYSNRTTVVLSANGDTMSYSGSFGLGTEVFVLVKQH